MIIPFPLRHILSGESPVTGSGRITSVVLAPDFSVSHPRPELTGFFDDVVGRARMRFVLPSLFSNLGVGGAAFVMVPLGCEMCGMGTRTILGDGPCLHPELIIDGALIISPEFAYQQAGDHFLRPLDHISDLVSEHGRRIIGEVISSGGGLVGVWRDRPIMVAFGEMSLVSIPMGPFWGMGTPSARFENQKRAVGDWIRRVCARAARLRGITTHGPDAETPIPASPNVTWS